MYGLYQERAGKGIEIIPHPGKDIHLVDKQTHDHRQDRHVEEKVPGQSPAFFPEGVSPVKDGSHGQAKDVERQMHQPYFVESAGVFHLQIVGELGKDQPDGRRQDLIRSCGQKDCKSHKTVLVFPGLPEPVQRHKTETDQGRTVEAGSQKHCGNEPEIPAFL